MGSQVASRTSSSSSRRAARPGETATQWVMRTRGAESSTPLVWGVDSVLDSVDTLSADGATIITDRDTLSADRGTARSPSPSSTPSPSLAAGVETPRSGVGTPELSAESLHLSTLAAVPTDSLASFFVEPMGHGMEPRHCARCSHGFDIGQLRLGYLYTRASPFLSAEEGVRHICWVHARGCARRIAVRPQRGSSRIRFSCSVSEDDRRRVMTELVARSFHGPALDPGTWDYTPARLQNWPTMLIGDPPPRRIPAAPGDDVALQHHQHHARVFLGEWVHSALLNMQLALLNGDGRADNTEADNIVSQEAMRSMLEMVPLERLSTKSREPCSICHEPMCPGEQCRRLPCFHLFHKNCIDRWLRLKGSCPLDKLLLSDMIAQQSRVQQPSVVASSLPSAARNRSRSARRR